MGYVLKVDRIPEAVVPGKRLGRHVLHDERSRRYAVRAADPTSLSSIQHQRRVPVFDQGNLGSCTGNAAVGALGTGALYDAVARMSVAFGEELAVEVYSTATTLDPFPGTYKPTDTGSDGLSVAKVLLSKGWISGYQHALSLEAALTALATNPVIVGVNWYEGFDEPSSAGMVKVSGQARGGHEFVLDGLDVAGRKVWATNSWGTGYGVQGRFCFSWDDLGALLSQDGDCTVLVPLTQPAPQPSPTPVPTDADHALMAVMDPWERTIVSRITKAGRVKAAYNAWKAAKGY